MVHSVRRGSWDCPGGRREPGETVTDCAARELAEETGLQVPTDGFVRCGYERITVAAPGHRAATRPLAQVFRAEVLIARPTVLSAHDINEDPSVSQAAFLHRCPTRFPLNPLHH